MHFSYTSKTQPPEPHLSSIENKRIAAILRCENKLLLEVNTKPGYNNITTFLNSAESRFSYNDPVRNAQQLITDRSGFINTIYKGCLPYRLERTFHKPDSPYNERGVYDNSIFVFDLQNRESILPRTPHRELVRYSEDDLKKLLKNDGSNGSSYYMFDLYCRRKEGSS